MKTSTRKASQRGVTLLELAVTLILMSAVAVGLAQLSERYATDVKNNLAAEHLRTIVDAASRYTRDNYSAVAAVATPTTAVRISTDILATTGYLEPGFSAKNGYQQFVCVLVLQPSPNKLQALAVSESGNAISDVDLGAIAAMAGGNAGTLASGGTTVVGTQGGWSISRSAYDNLANSDGKHCDGTTAGNVRLTDGHLAYALWFDPASATFMTQWKDPVPTSTALPSTGNVNGDTRLVLDINRSYTWNSGAWYANGLTNDGYLRGPNNATAVSQGASCTGVPAGTLAKDAAGNLFVCN